MEDKEEAYRYGDVIGVYLNELGINVDFAPDADVLTNSSNSVIGDRFFGTDPQKVSNFAKAYSDGLHAHGVLSAYKHFPGHGATEVDTHKGIYPGIFYLLHSASSKRPPIQNIVFALPYTFHSQSQ